MVCVDTNSETFLMTQLFPEENFYVQKKNMQFVTDKQNFCWQVLEGWPSKLK